MQSEEIKALKDYLAFLEAGYSRTFSMAYAHHYRETEEDIEKGKQLRDAIKNAQQPKEGGSDELKSLLEDIDFELAMYEDYLHGKHGQRVTELRYKIKDFLKKWSLLIS